MLFDPYGFPMFLSPKGGAVFRTLQGDVNGDGVVDVFDLSIVGSAYGYFEGEHGYNADADLNEDGLFDGRDLAMVTINWGKTIL